MVFLFILISITIITILLTTSKIQMQIINFKFSSQKTKKVNEDYEIIIKLIVLRKIPIFKISITKDKLKNPKLKEKAQKINWQAIQNKETDKNVLKSLKELKVDIKNINLNVELGTENACLTSIIVPAISTAITIWLGRKVKYDDQIFIMQPVYRNQNLINILISGIFELKMKHIISMIYMLKQKEGVKYYERTSNRRAYDYSYE